MAAVEAGEVAATQETPAGAVLARGTPGDRGRVPDVKEPQDVVSEPAPDSGVEERGERQAAGVAQGRAPGPQGEVWARPAAFALVWLVAFASAWPAASASAWPGVTAPVWRGDRHTVARVLHRPRRGGRLGKRESRGRPE